MQSSRENSWDYFVFHELRTHSKQTLFHRDIVLPHCHINSFEDYAWHGRSSWKRSPLWDPLRIGASCIYVNNTKKGRKKHTSEYKSCNWSKGDKMARNQILKLQKSTREGKKRGKNKLTRVSPQIPDDTFVSLNMLY